MADDSFSLVRGLKREWVLEIIEIDKKVYGRSYDPISPSHPENYFVLINNKSSKPIGYFLIMGLSDKLYKEMKEEKISEDDLILAKTESIEKADVAYISSIAIDKGQVPSAMVLKLVRTLIEVLKKSNAKKLFAIAVTKEGERICEILKMKKYDNYKGTKMITVGNYSPIFFEREI